LAEQIRGHVHRLLDAVDPDAEIDLVGALAAPLPVLVIAEFLGVPEAVRPDFRRWSDATIEASDGRAALSPAALDAIVELVAFLEDLVTERAAAPGDDVVSLLVGAEIGGRPLRRSELVTFVMTLLVAGNETTRHLLSTGLVTLADHPDQRGALAADPGLTPTAVEELLRWVTPIQQFARTATGDTDVGGEAVAEGDYLVLLYASGNRDEAVFGPTAAGFDAGRPIEAPNLAFGFGEHLCLGAALARLEARVVVDEILARHPHYEIAGDIEWVASSLVRGPARVPVVLR
jgi:cytochrome P450